MIVGAALVAFGAVFLSVSVSVSVIVIVIVIVIMPVIVAALENGKEKMKWLPFVQTWSTERRHKTRS
jgi:hypothetical protein